MKAEDFAEVSQHPCERFVSHANRTPNLMVLEPGGYRFSDYWRFGLPLMGLYFVAAVVLVPLVWRF